MKYLPPTDSWPNHSRPLASAALEDARKAGWWFGPSGRSGHAFGRLRCRPPHLDEDDTACWVFVWSTSGSADGSDTARAIRDAIRKCPHKRESVDQQPDAEASSRLASGKLAQVAALIESAEALLREATSRRDADEALDRALEQLEEDRNAGTGDLEQQIGDLEDLARVQQGRAYSSALRGGAGDPWPPADGARELAELAQTGLEQASELIAGAAGVSGGSRLLAERDRLRTRLEIVSGQLASDR